MSCCSLELCYKFCRCICDCINNTTLCVSDYSSSENLFFFVVIPIIGIVVMSIGISIAKQLRGRRSSEDPPNYSVRDRDPPPEYEI